MIRCLFLLAIANHSLTFVWPSFKVLRLYFQLGNSALRNQTRTKTPWRDQLAIQCNVYSLNVCKSITLNFTSKRVFFLTLNFLGPTDRSKFCIYIFNWVILLFAIKNQMKTSEMFESTVPLWSNWNKQTRGIIAK